MNSPHSMVAYSILSRVHLKLISCTMIARILLKPRMKKTKLAGNREGGNFAYFLLKVELPQILLKKEDFTARYIDPNPSTNLILDQLLQLHDLLFLRTTLNISESRFC